MAALLIVTVKLLLAALLIVAVELLLAALLIVAVELLLAALLIVAVELLLAALIVTVELLLPLTVPLLTIGRRSRLKLLLFLDELIGNLVNLLRDLLELPCVLVGELRRLTHVDHRGLHVMGRHVRLAVQVLLGRFLVQPGQRQRRAGQGLADLIGRNLPPLKPGLGRKLLQLLSGLFETLTCLALRAGRGHVQIRRRDAQVGGLLIGILLIDLLLEFPEMLRGHLGEDDQLRLGNLNLLATAPIGLLPVHPLTVNLLAVNLLVALSLQALIVAVPLLLILAIPLLVEPLFVAVPLLPVAISLLLLLLVLAVLLVAILRLCKSGCPEHTNRSEHNRAKSSVAHRTRSFLFAVGHGARRRRRVDWRGGLLLDKRRTPS